MDETRLRAIWESTITRLQEVVREHGVTQRELHEAGDFLNRLGQSGMSRSLIDVALGMTSVDVHDRGRGGTRPNLEGPYHAEHPFREDGNLVEQTPSGGAIPLLIEGVVSCAATGRPVPGAVLDFWQANETGIYDRKGTHLRGKVRADGAGRYAVRTIVPRDYSEHDHDPIGELFRAMGRHNIRSAHIHLKVLDNGQERLTTQLFLPTSDVLEDDYVAGAFSEDLLLKLEPMAADDPSAGYRASCDIVLPRPPVSAG